MAHLDGNPPEKSHYAPKQDQYRTDAGIQFRFILVCSGMLTHWGLGEISDMLQVFSNEFLEKTMFNFDFNFSRVCSWWTNSQYASIGSVNGLVSSRRQATAWTLVLQVLWRLMVSANSKMNKRKLHTKSETIMHIVVWDKKRITNNWNNEIVKTIILLSLETLKAVNMTASIASNDDKAIRPDDLFVSLKINSFIR